MNKINIPNGVVEIKANTFRGCTALKDVNIPDSVVNIHMSAFANCNNLPEMMVIGKGNLGDSLAWKVTKKVN